MAEDYVDTFRVSATTTVLETEEDKSMLADKQFQQALSMDIADEEMAQQLNNAAKQRILAEKWQHERQLTRGPGLDDENRSDYYQEDANGFGYVFDLIRLNDNGALSRYMAKVFVLQGMAEQAHYEYHELVITKQEPIQQLLLHKDAIKDKSIKVLVHFNMMNPRARAFVNRTVDNEPKMAACITGYLTDISLIKVDDTIVYPPEAE